MSFRPTAPVLIQAAFLKFFSQWTGPLYISLGCKSNSPLLPDDSCFFCSVSTEFLWYSTLASLQAHTPWFSAISGPVHLQLTAPSPLLLTPRISSRSWDSCCSSLLVSGSFLSCSFKFIYLLLSSSYRRVIKHLCPSQQLSGCFLNPLDTFQFECVGWEVLEWWYPWLCMSFPHPFLLFAIFFSLCSKNRVLQYALGFWMLGKIIYPWMQWELLGGCLSVTVRDTQGFTVCLQVKVKRPHQ